MSRYPLSAGNRHVYIFYTLAEVDLDAVPKEGRIFIDKVGGRGIPELSNHADLFKFEVKGVLLFASTLDRQAARLDLQPVLISAPCPHSQSSDSFEVESE
jgi:hypothetical protein